MAALATIARAVGSAAQLALLCLLLALVPVTTPWAQTTSAPPNILLLHTYHPDMPWSALFGQGLRDRSGEEAGAGPRLYVEWLDTARLTADHLDQAYATQLGRKYAASRIDVVIADDLYAAQFIADHGRDLAPGTPLIYVSSIQAEFPEPATRPVHWLPTVVDYGANLPLIRALRPAARRIVVLMDQTPHSRQRRALLDEALSDPGSGFSLEYLTDFAMEGLPQRLAGLPSDAVVVYCLVFQDNTGKRFVPKQVAEIAAAAAPVPVFTYWDSLLGSGVVGGYVVSAEVSGRSALDLALRLAAGEDVSAGQAPVEGQRGHVFDWRALRRWRIDPASIPGDSVVKFRKPTFWEVYGRWILVGGAIVVLQGVLVLALFVNRRRLARLNLTLEDRVERRTGALNATERQLRDERDRAQSVIDLMSLALVELDTDGTVQRVNRRCLEMLGREEHDVVGTEWFTLAVPEPDRQRVREAHREILAGGGAVQDQFENRVVDAAGKTHQVVWRNALLRDAHGGVAGTRSCGLDVTEHRALEEALRRTQKLEAIGTLVGGIAHDFNNLLQVLLGEAEMLMEGLGAGHPMLDHVQTVNRTSERAARLTGQLLAFGRKQVTRPRVIDVNAVLHELEKMLRRLIGEDIELVTSFAADLDPCRLDPGQVEQVVMNLVLNARDAMPNGGALRVETGNQTVDPSPGQPHTEGLEAGRYVVITVRDSGTGMDEVTRERIFEPFFTTKNLAERSGLGLASLYGIVKQNQGHVTVHSEPGAGTTFQIYFPSHGAPENQPNDTPAVPPRPPPGGGTVLLVEDDPHVMGIIRTHLGSLGYQVLSAGNPEEALARAAGHQGEIDLLLTDVVMPGRSGKQLAEEFLAARPGTPVLYMSGYTEETISHHGVLEDRTFFLEKPFTKAQLGSRLAELLPATGDDGSPNRGH